MELSDLGENQARIKIRQNLFRARTELEMLEITPRHPEHEGKRENNCLKEVKEAEEDHQASTLMGSKKSEETL